MNKDEALRLADALENPGADFDCSEVAAELRRLHAENKDFRLSNDNFYAVNELRANTIDGLEDQNRELIKALKTLVKDFKKQTVKAQAVIDKVEALWAQ